MVVENSKRRIFVVRRKFLRQFPSKRIRGKFPIATFRRKFPTDIFRRKFPTDHFQWHVRRKSLMDHFRQIVSLQISVRKYFFL